jgi:translation initiation factor 5A
MNEKVVFMYEKKSVDVGSLKKGDTIIIDDAPCKVVDATVSKSGKHGHAKVNLTAVGILDDKKRNLVLPSHDKVEAPIIEKKSAQILSISGNKANVMDTETYETFELDIPEDLKGVKEGVEVLYWEVMGTKVMKQVK